MVFICPLSFNCFWGLSWFFSEWSYFEIQGPKKRVDLIFQESCRPDSSAEKGCPSYLKYISTTWWWCTKERRLKPKEPLNNFGLEHSYGLCAPVNIWQSLKLKRRTDILREENKILQRWSSVVPRQCSMWFCWQRCRHIWVPKEQWKKRHSCPKRYILIMRFWVL